MLTALQAMTQQLADVKQWQRAVAFAIALTIDTPLAPKRYELLLLDRYQRGELSIEAVIRLLDTSTYHILYRSQATNFPSEPQLQQILEWSRIYNEQQDITGLLLYSDGRFAQFIEGEEAKLHHLFDRIQQDSRHQHVVVISEGPAPYRWFADWRMAFGQIEPVELSQLLRVVETGRQPLYPLQDPHVQTLVEAFGLADHLDKCTDAP
jgi:hypothetical protein